MISREDLERFAQLKSDHGILSAYIRAPAPSLSSEIETRTRLFSV